MVNYSYEREFLWSKENIKNENTTAQSLKLKKKKFGSKTLRYNATIFPRDLKEFKSKISQYKKGSKGKGRLKHFRLVKGIHSGNNSGRFKGNKIYRLFANSDWSERGNFWDS